jgi:hypothetical protein
MNIRLQLRTTQEAQNLNMKNRFTDSVQSFWVENVGSNIKIVYSKTILIQTAYTQEY